MVALCDYFYESRPDEWVLLELEIFRCPRDVLLSYYDEAASVALSHDDLTLFRDHNSGSPRPKDLF